MRSYRYGFNGMEKDDEVKGSGNSYDFGARIYDPRVGRFLSVDPIGSCYPFESFYIFGGNSPLHFIDLAGLIKVEDEASLKKDYPKLYEYLSNNSILEVMTHKDLVEQLKEIGKFTEEGLKEALSWGNPPYLLTFTTGVAAAYGAGGEYDCVEETISLSPEMLKAFEDAISLEDKEATLLHTVSTILHEIVHHGRAEYYESHKKEIHQKINKYNERQKDEHDKITMDEKNFSKRLHDLFDKPAINKRVIPNNYDYEAGRALEFAQWQTDINSRKTAKEVIMENKKNESKKFTPTVP